MTSTMQAIRPLNTNSRRTSRISLLPVQAAALDDAVEAFRGHNVVFVGGAPGSGRTLVFDHLQRALGGRILGAREVLAAFERRDPAAMEEALIDLVLAAHADHDIVYFDDLATVSVPSVDSDRPGFSDQLFQMLFEGLQARGKKIALSWTGPDPEQYGSSFGRVEIGRFGPGDYRTIIEHHAAESFDTVDFDEIHRAYRELSGSELAFIGRIIGAECWPEVTTAAIIALADAYLAQTNIDMEEIAPVSLDTLVGIEPLIDSLDRTVLIPMTQPALARELGLKPKRGVLLYGEPGTGKTTIGRALAQRMKGKFFMIDGTFMPDDQFYMKFDRIMTNAVKNSPAVIFIDDADVLFRNGEMMGLARLLLSKLDGLESETQSQVCIVMTAMDVADMPPAMVRSGRVEVWLEMRLPDADRRVAMIRHFAASLDPSISDFNAPRVAEATAGFTPADLRGFVGDARGHLAYDRQQGRDASTFEQHLLTAAREIAARRAVLKALGA